MKSWEHISRWRDVPPPLPSLSLRGEYIHGINQVTREAKKTQRRGFGGLSKKEDRGGRHHLRLFLLLLRQGAWRIALRGEVGSSRARNILKRRAKCLSIFVFFKCFLSCSLFQIFNCVPYKYR